MYLETSVFRKKTDNVDHEHTLPGKRMGTARGTCILGIVELAHIVPRDGGGQRCDEPSSC